MPDADTCWSRYAKVGAATGSGLTSDAFGTVNVLAYPARALGQLESEPGRIPRLNFGPSQQRLFAFHLDADLKLL